MWVCTDWNQGRNLFFLPSNSSYSTTLRFDDGSEKSDDVELW